MDITARDVQALELVYRLKFLTIPQATWCIYRNRNVAQRRLRCLERAGLVRAFAMPHGTRGHPAKVVYLNSRKRTQLESLLGFSVDPGMLISTPPENALAARHTLELNTVLAALIAGCAARDYTVQYIPEYWTTAGQKAGRLLDEEVRHPQCPSRFIRYRRDAVCCIGTPCGTALFEIEYDRGTEAITSAAHRAVTLAHKLRVFLESVQQRRFDRYASPEFFGHPFQVSRLLLITTTQSRLDHIATASQELNTHGLVYLSTFSAITPETVLADMWTVPDAGQLYTRPLVGAA